MKPDLVVGGFALVATMVRPSSPTAGHHRPRPVGVVSTLDDVHPERPELLPMFRKGFTTKLEPLDGVQVERCYTSGSPEIPLLAIHPAAQQPAAPAILWLHGGALVMGTPEAEAKWVSVMARAAGAVVVIPAYRLAPEHRFPAPLDDCMTALRWMLDNTDELDIDPARVVVAGGRAGGGLTAAVAQRCRDENVAIRAQILCSPMLDDRTVLKPENLERPWFMVGPKSIRFGWTSYLGHAPTFDHEPAAYAAPARTADVRDLAPAWIGVGDQDLFHAEAVAYGERLVESGVECEVVVAPGMYHGASFVFPEAESSVRFDGSMLDFLKSRLAD